MYIFLKQVTVYTGIRNMAMLRSSGLAVLGRSEVIGTCADTTIISQEPKIALIFIKISRSEAEIYYSPKKFQSGTRNCVFIVARVAGWPDHSCIHTDPEKAAGRGRPILDFLH